MLMEAMGYGVETVVALYQGMDKQLQAETLARSPQGVRSVIQQNLKQAHPELFTMEKFAR
jgi:hypothetical protein